MDQNEVMSVGSAPDAKEKEKDDHIDGFGTVVEQRCPSCAGEWVGTMVY